LLNLCLSAGESFLSAALTEITKSLFFMIASVSVKYKDEPEAAS